MYMTPDGRWVPIAGWPTPYKFPEEPKEQNSACGNGHVGPVGTTCTQDGCGKLIVNTH
jgi:hypothetical protein